MNWDTIRFLKATYREHYFRDSDRIEFPGKIQEREFGYMPFGGGMVRHLAFRSAGEAVAEIVRQAPSSVYCSNALYESPSLPMEEKGWKGAELIFDIDASDIPTPCKREHDVWFCHDCSSKGRLPRPQRCPNCAQANIEEIHNVCEVCLEAAKDHAIRLIRLLTEDFSVQPGAMTTYFSGNRGYHLHVHDSRFDPLDAVSRAEIADYVRGAGMLIPQGFVLSLRRSQRLEETAALANRGWLGRIAKFLSSSSSPSLPQPEAKEKKDGIHAQINRAIEAQVSRVDPSVTTDIHRVFRMPGTLHGSTGLLKIKVKSLERFKPLSDPVVLGSTRVKVSVNYSPQFTLNGEMLGPFKSESVSIPTYAAVYLLARGLAEVS
jgi:DNA primase small subunit